MPGDIEKQAEKYLVAQYPEELKSNVLVAAHHGSKSSSSPVFINQIAPQYTIISAGFDNRYHFPHQFTLDTLMAAKTSVKSTIDCGMVSLLLPDNREKKIQPSCYKNV